MSTVKVTINGREVVSDANSTVLTAARSSGIKIPTLCYHERLSPIASCGMCVVEISGMDEPVEACSTMVAEGMVITTDSDRLLGMRQEALKRLLVHHPLDCPICDKAGECMLQDQVFEYGVRADDYQAPQKPREAVYATNLIKHWPDRCVLCLRCVTACREIKGARALDVAETEDGRRIVGDPDRCVHCGECLQVCPVGALTENLSPTKGRSFLVKKVPTTCTYCGCGCQMDLHVLDNQVVSVTGREDPGVNEGSLCVKGRFGYEFVKSDQRLTKPLIKRNGKLEEAEWDEAIRLMARKLGNIKKEYGPDAIGGFASARCTNEDNYLFQKFMRAVIGTNNVDHCARL
ncbi:MAG: molybdopterin-dependent oxidoreductase [Syntrophobacteraceae bacterium]|nr:molybdopterin-dependent oxidoreductase [Syntrophobacteraceae bacterium]